jgi:uncharacterized membrane protein
MSDTTPNAAPEPTPLDEAAAAAAASPPTYSPPTTAPETPPVAVAVAAPAPVTGQKGGRGARSGGIMGGVILIVLGGIFLVSEFVPGIDIGRLWPLILVAIGIGIILRRR